MSFKSKVRALARRLANAPVIGRFVRILVALIRLPETRESYHAFMEKQLPSLISSIAEINQRQISVDKGRDNFIESGPIAIRSLARQIKELSQRFDELPRQNEVGLERMDRIENNLGELQKTVENTSARAEFIRRELMFEMRYGASEPKGDDKSKMSNKILDEEKFRVCREKGNVRLNLGCGHVPLEGYINVDMRELPSVDVVAPVDNLPFVEGEVSEIFSAHLLEHFPVEQLRRNLLPYWAGLLRAGGVFKAIVPDAEGMMDAYAKKEYSFEQLRLVTFGGQDYDGDFHFNMFSPDSLAALLKEQGFSDIKILDRNRENHGCKEFEISARR